MIVIDLGWVRITKPRTEIEGKETGVDSFGLFTVSILISSVLVVYQINMK